ncbi:MAG: hypothetical protein U0521_06850 [Anaerolineae bacterium]
MLDITGPEALSQADLARIASGITGREIAYVPLEAGVRIDNLTKGRAADPGRRSARILQQRGGAGQARRGFGCRRDADRAQSQHGSPTSSPPSTRWAWRAEALECSVGRSMKSRAEGRFP